MNETPGGETLYRITAFHTIKPTKVSSIRGQPGEKALSPGTPGFFGKTTGNAADVWEDGCGQVKTIKITSKMTTA